MKPQALEAARSALARTEEEFALLSMQPLTAFASPQVDTASIWSDLLVHGNRVFTKLDQGSKNGPSKGWNDRLKKHRKTDPILSYMMHARNADEHGISLIYTEDKAHVSVTIPAGLNPGQTIVRFVNDDKGELSDIVPGGPYAQITSKRRYEFRLSEVSDRGLYYQAPTDNAGQPFEGHPVIAIAQIFIEKLRVIVEEASHLPSN